MTSANHTSQSSKMEFGSDPSPPNQFWYTFEDKLEEEAANNKHASRKSKMDFGSDTKSAKSVSEYF